MRTDDQAVGLMVKPDDIQTLCGANAHSLSLADGIVSQTLMPSEDTTFGINNLSRPGIQAAGQEGAAVIIRDETDVLAFPAAGRRQAQSAG